MNVFTGSVIMDAQNIFSNIISGITIFLFRPIKLHEAVLFDNDFGWIEKIVLIHTIIRTWDGRQVFIPNNIFLKKIAQNWTIVDSSLLSIMMMYADYSCNIDKLERWVREIVDHSHYSMDEKVTVLQVIGFTEKKMVLRILAKALNAYSTVNLSCEIQEKLIEKFKEADLPIPQITIEDTNLLRGTSSKRLC
jgi:small-conductance mechanosensitive channel